MILLKGFEDAEAATYDGLNSRSTQKDACDTERGEERDRKTEERKGVDK